MADRFDVIVIGVGSMGAAACYYLARRGIKVLGIEQFDITHERGSHTGQSRIIRKAYFEHPDYVPLLNRAYENWRKIELETKTEIYHRTGIVYFGKPDHETMIGIRQSSFLYRIPVEKLSTPTSVRANFPHFQVPADFETLVERDAGFVTPEVAIRSYAMGASQDGATIVTNEKVMTWRQAADGIEVVTDKNSYRADKLVITAGSWSSKIIPALRTDLKVTRQMLAWVKPKVMDHFMLGHFPCWFIEDPERGMFYGFPVLPTGRFGGPAGLKLAHHRPGEITDPDIVQSHLSKQDEDNIHYVLSKYIPEAEGPLISYKYCLYTYTKDENFIIDHLPGYSDKVVIACGFSGHGFKFVSVVGEVLADLAMKGKTDLPIGFLRLSRFL